LEVLDCIAVVNDWGEELERKGTFLGYQYLDYYIKYSIGRFYELLRRI
jgi:hypothetical protein